MQFMWELEDWEIPRPGNIGSVLFGGLPGNRAIRAEALPVVRKADGEPLHEHRSAAVFRELQRKLLETREGRPKCRIGIW